MFRHAIEEQGTHWYGWEEVSCVVFLRTVVSFSWQAPREETGESYYGLVKEVAVSILVSLVLFTVENGDREPEKVSVSTGAKAKDFVSGKIKVYRERLENYLLLVSFG